MNRYSYLVVALAIVVLAAYLLWPPSADDTYRQVWSGEQPQQFTLHTPELVQRVDGDTVQVGDLPRPLEQRSLAGLWQVFSSLRANRWRSVSEADLPAFGIGQWRLEAPGVDLRWGQEGEQSYVYNGASGEVFILHRDTFHTINRAAGRLDIPDLLPRGVSWQSLRIVHGSYEEELLLQRQDDHDWLAPEAPHRPSFAGRVRELLDLLSHFRLQRLDPEAPSPAVTQAQLYLQGDQGKEWSLRWWRDADDQPWLSVDDLPAQSISQSQQHVLEETLAAFTTNPLFDLPVRAADPTLQRVEVWRDGEWFMSVEADEEGRSSTAPLQYSVRWLGGREEVQAREVWALQQALSEVTVEQVSLLADEDEGLQAWLQRWQDEEQPHIHLRAWDSRDQLRVDLHLLGEGVRSASHAGQAGRVPELLRDIQPARMVDRRLLPNVHSARLNKLQRVNYISDGDSRQPQAEVFSREGDRWQQNFPQGESADSAALERIIGSLLNAEAEAVDLLSEVSEEAPERSLALRIAGLSDADGRAEADLLHTMDRDWGLRLFQREDGDWDAEAVDGGLRYRLAEELVAGWFAPLQELPVIPVLANEIMALRFEVRRRPDDDYRLRRTTDGDWRLEQGQRSEMADASEVRRLLQSLTTLHATRRDPEAAIMSPDESAARLYIRIPGRDYENDRLTLAIGAEEDGQRQLSLHREGSRALAYGRFWVADETVAPLLSPSQRYRPLRQDILGE